MKRDISFWALWGALLCAGAFAATGNEGGHSGDPYELDFLRRARFVVHCLREQGSVTAWQLDELERGRGDLRVEVTDETLATTGKVFEDPLRVGFSFVKLDRKKYSQALRDRFSVDMNVFVAHEVFETRGLDYDRGISQTLHFSEKAFEVWHEGEFKKPYPYVDGHAAGGGSQQTIVTGNGGVVVTAPGNTVVTGNGGTIVTGGGNTVVTGNGGTIVTGGGSAVVAGNGGTVVQNSSSGYYAAIAYSPSTGRGGRSWYQPSQAAAEAAAVQSCGVSDCRTAIWVRSGCAAVYRAQNDSTAYSWNWGSERSWVESTTRNFCESHYRTKCFQVDSVCSG